MTKPNIIMIVTDQQRFDTIEAHGNPYIKTPVLNRLAASGVTFTRAYSPCPVCVPARYGMLTGQAPHRTGCVDNQPTTPRPSLMQMLSGRGYVVHGVGKMHFTFQGENNLDYLWGFDSRDTSEEIEARDDYGAFLKENGYGHVRDPHGVRSEMYYIPQPSQLPEGLHHSAWVVDRGLDYLQRRDADKPFFLKLSFIKPHPPFETPAPWNKLYRGPDMPMPKLPDGFERLITYWNKFQNRYKYRDQGSDRNLVRTMIAAYYSTISFIDYQLGRLMAHMEDEGLLDNTLLLFTSDHGELLGDYQCFGKRSFLDSAARIPMLLVYPGCPQGMQSDVPVTLLDIVPTLLDYAGIEPEENYSGESMLRILSGQSRRDIVYGQFQQRENGLYMAATRDFKYIYSAPDQREWLFDLVRDPQETRSVAGNPLFGMRTEQMRHRLIDYFKRENYMEPLDGDNWKAYSRKEMPEDPDALLLMQDPPESIPQIEGYRTDSAAKAYYRGLEM